MHEGWGHKPSTIFSHRRDCCNCSQASRTTVRRARMAATLVNAYTEKSKWAIGECRKKNLKRKEMLYERGNEDKEKLIIIEKERKREDSSMHTSTFHDSGPLFLFHQHSPFHLLSNSRVKMTASTRAVRSVNPRHASARKASAGMS